MKKSKSFLECEWKQSKKWSRVIGSLARWFWLLFFGSKLVAKGEKQEAMETKPRGLPIVHNQLKRKEKERQKRGNNVWWCMALKFQKWHKRNAVIDTKKRLAKPRRCSENETESFFSLSPRSSALWWWWKAPTAVQRQLVTWFMLNFKSCFDFSFSPILVTSWTQA